MIEEDGSLSSKTYIALSIADETFPVVATNEINDEYLVTWTQPHQVGSAIWDSVFVKNLTYNGTKTS